MKAVSSGCAFDTISVRSSSVSHLVRWANKIGELDQRFFDANAVKHRSALNSRANVFRKPCEDLNGLFRTGLFDSSLLLIK
jgi:hypothetical protein